MDELVSKTDIQEYAKRNTSPKMPIEEKYVFSFLNSLLNSTTVKDVYEELLNKMQANDGFVMFNSMSESANMIPDTLRHIVSYSMIKKDMRLFELISASLFTGSIAEYHSPDLSGFTVETTDEMPLRYTDEIITTDMIKSLIIIGFKNYYCNDPQPGDDRFQTQEELENSLATFETLITMCKPARIEVFLFNVPWCYLSGNETEIISSGIDTSDPYFSAPFGDPDSMEILANYSDYELINSYRKVSLFDIKDDIRINYDIEAERTVTQGPGFIMFDYELKYYYDGMTEEIWKKIQIESNDWNKYFVKVRAYIPDEEYFEKYVPIMLRINDNDPGGPCLALQIDNGVPTVGAMFYTREKKN